MLIAKRTNMACAFQVLQTAPFNRRTLQTLVLSISRYASKCKREKFVCDKWFKSQLLCGVLGSNSSLY